MDLSPFIEHTLLAADATPEAIDELCEQAIGAGLFGVCVNPCFVPRAKQRLGTSLVRLVTVVGFPLGATPAEVKVFEAEWAVREGAHEIDMVISIGMAKAQAYDFVEAEVRRVRDAVPSAVLKVILETGALEPHQIEDAAHAAVRAGADFLKTSTGFGPRGATQDDVQRLKRCATGNVGVKASGGIRSREQALLMVQAGATRIGTSNGVNVAGLSQHGGRFEHE